MIFAPLVERVLLLLGVAIPVLLSDSIILIIINIIYIYK